MHVRTRLIALAALAAAFGTAQAATWSDTALSVRYGSDFAEPYVNAPDGSRNNISKTIVGLTHASGYKYGTNFFNVDMLLSDNKDPGDNTTSGAQEVYVVYRNTLDLGKVTGSTYKFGPVRGLGLTGGFDINTKNDSYGSKKRMFVVGPTLMMDVPGFLNLTAFVLDESNAPNGVTRYHYKNHGALEADWGIPVGGPLPLKFEGYAQFIASKGTNEFGGPTAPETHVDAELMLDVGAVAGSAKDTFKLGLEYEYWHNKFGNQTTSSGTNGAGPGATARTPMIRGEYHF